MSRKKNSDRIYGIIRLGISELCEIDALAMNSIIEPGVHDIIGVGTPFGLFSIVNTDYSAEYIKNEYVKFSKKLNDHAPVIVWDLDSSSSDFDLRDFPQIKETIDEFYKRYNNKDYIPFSDLEEDEVEPEAETVDEVLDKISRGGMSSLSEAELDLLKNASNK